MQEQELVKVSGQELVLEPKNKSDIMGTIKGALSEKWINSDLIAEKLYKMLDAKWVTNSWIVFDDNKAILDALKLILKLSGAQNLWDGPNIAIFNNVPWKNEKLKY